MKTDKRNTEDQVKRLLLIRHAKAEPIYQEITDFERNLSDRGVNDAQKMADLLLKKNMLPDLIIASSATRTLQTARIFAGTLKYPLDKIVEKPGLYNSYTTQNFLDMLAKYGGDKQTIAVVAHNPEIGNLAFKLSEDFFDAMKTCTVVGLEFDVDNWDKIEVRTGKVILYEYPQKVKD